MVRETASAIEERVDRALERCFTAKARTTARAKVAKAAPNAAVMHPGPMNRGVEIDSALADDPERSLITLQVEMGVAVRMACLELLLLA